MPFCQSPAPPLPHVTATGVGASDSPSQHRSTNGHWRWGAFKQHHWLHQHGNGAFALFSNITGNANTADGVVALYNNTTGGHNTAIGWQALHDNTTGSNNTATGVNALIFNFTGDDNTANGYQAGFNITGSGRRARLAWGKQYHLDPQCEHGVSEF